MSYSDTPVSTRRRARRDTEERRLLLGFAFVWIGSLASLALAWYTLTPAL